MCYRAGVDLDFRGVRIACLSGDNGAGKSALLDCITWALWGKARVNSDRDLIALNATEMEVTFGFELNHQEFRVTRRRTRGGSGPLSLDIQTLDDDRWRTISGTTVRETQRAIDQLLKMDYDTFINSAFILQGRADEFTTKTPALRKQTLAEILNLSDYDRFENLARQLFKDHEGKLREFDADIQRIDQRLGELPTRRGEVEALSRELIEKADRVEEATERSAGVRQRLNLLEIAAKQRDQTHREIMALNDEIEKLDQERRKTASRIEAHQAILARHEVIESRYRELTELRREQEQVGIKLARRQTLLQEQRSVEVEIQRATNAIQSQLQSVRDRIEIESHAAGGRAQLEADRSRLRAQIDTAERDSRSLEALRTAQSTLEGQRGELNAANRQLKAEMQDLKSRMDQIEQASAVCPVCRRELGSAERIRLGREYLSEGKALGDRYRENNAAMKQIDSDLEKNKQDRLRLERLRAHAELLSKQEVSLLERLAACDRADNKISELRDQEQALVVRLSSGSVAAKERAMLKDIDERLTQVPFDEAHYRSIQNRLAELAGVEQEIGALLTASASVASDRQHLVTIDDSITQRTATRSEKSVQELELSQQVEGLDQVRLENDSLAAELQRVERERGILQERFGAAQQRVQDLERLQEQREAHQRERRKVAEEVTTFDELALAFGKRGIQAMIIENVVPELQDEANRILDKMPGNTMRVEFRTQRQAVRGEGTIETLDIVISDEVGSRAYELYSGGEAFRVNFAIRVALSMLLAKRSGARLQTLVIDEGFGTQDSRGRDGLIEAIRAVEPEFRMILVITHIADLKDVFPTRIEVVKGVDGSLVTIN